MFCKSAIALHGKSLQVALEIQPALCYQWDNCPILILFFFFIFDMQDLHNFSFIESRR